MNKVSCDFISCAANTISSGVVWCEVSNYGDVVIYASHNLIVVADTKIGKVLCSLRGHTKRVNAVSLVHSTKDFVEIVSCSEDHTVKTWRHMCSDPIDVWRRNEFTLDVSLSSPVITVASCVIELGAANVTVVSASDSSGQIISWQRNSFGHSYVEVDQVKMPPASMARQLHLSPLPVPPSTINSVSSLVLFIGGVDARIHLRTLTVANNSNDLTTITTTAHSVGHLSGHEEWVTCLATTLVAPNELLLASGSQDTKTRVWKIVAIGSVKPLTGSSSEGIDPETVLNPEVLDVLEGDSEDEDDETDVGGGGGGSGGMAVLADATVLEEDNTSEARLIFDVAATAASTDTATQGVYRIAVYLEALLVGHEDWVTSVNWMPPQNNDNSNKLTNQYRLFTTSMDRNMVIWNADPFSGVWIPAIRVGDIGGLLGGSVGANLLGFVGGCRSTDGLSLLGIGYGGSFHLWTCSSTPDNVEAEMEESQASRELWRPIPFLTGHFGAVNDLAWSAGGEYLVTAACDQTCRLFAPRKVSAGGHQKQWCEVSRPEIHGYDLNSVVLYPNNLPRQRHNDNSSNINSSVEGSKADISPFLLFSAGDEKVIRVFDASQTVIMGLESLCGIKIEDTNEQRISRAYIPELGLSNRASDLMTKQEIAEQEIRNVSSLDWRTQPLEGQLADHTVWPEMKKLFGHNNDILCLAISSSGRWLASSAKSKVAAGAYILLWDVTRMENVAKFIGHESSVVSLRFSPDERCLASVGKDRILCFHDISEFSTASASSQSTRSTVPLVRELSLGVKNAHKRIIWDCCWTSDSKHLITVSRDGSCKMWTMVGEGNSNNNSSEESVVPATSFVPFSSTVAATSVDCIRIASSNRYLLVFGAENGDLSIWCMLLTDNTADRSSDGVEVTKLHDLESKFAHGDSVTKVRWNPNSHERGFQFASCSEDNSVRVFTVDL